MKWKGKPIEAFLDGVNIRGGLSYSFRCLVCDLAFEMKLSENEFYDKYDMSERAQLVATYRSQLDRETVRAIAPQQ
jgi:hypothetical protein